MRKRHAGQRVAEPCSRICSARLACSSALSLATVIKLLVLSAAIVARCSWVNSMLEITRFFKALLMARRVAIPGINQLLLELDNSLRRGWRSALKVVPLFGLGNKILAQPLGAV